MPKYVLTENGNIKVKDGKPLVVGDDEKEYNIDAIGAAEKIADLNSEAAGHRKKAKEYKTALTKFEGIEDPAAALEALQTVASIGGDHKVEIEKLKTSMTAAYEDKIKEKEDKIAGLSNKLFDATVTAKFATSPVMEKLVLTPDIAVSFFGKNFKDDGTAIDASGNTIYSKEKPGEPAPFDEALQHMVDNYPNKEAILKASTGKGSGFNGDQGGTGGDAPASSVDMIKAGLAARQ